MRQRAELGARLLVHDPATQVVRHLFIVHDELQAQGWTGVDALPAKVLDLALLEAEILHADEPSALLATIIAKLGELKAAATARDLEKALEREFETMKGARSLRHQLRRVRADGAQLGRHRAQRARAALANALSERRAAAFSGA